MRNGRYSQAEAKRALANVGLLTIEVDKLKGALLDAETEREQFRRWWHDERATNKEAREDAKLARSERDQMQDELLREKLAHAGERAQRLKLQGYIEGMLDGTHPRRPKLPWEASKVEGRYVGSVGEFRIED